jgi:hypothetical protein
MFLFIESLNPRILQLNIKILTKAHLLMQHVGPSLDRLLIHQVALPTPRWPMGSLP